LFECGFFAKSRCIGLLAMEEAMLGKEIPAQSFLTDNTHTVGNGFY
jgi:hypothetical protein